jgi:opacity protein-like surface antigen
MKNTLLTIVGAAAILALAQSTQAVPITGAIGFAGNATLNSSTAHTATTVTGWSGASTANPVVQSSSGILGGILAPNTQIAFKAPWTFTVNDLINSFWSAVGPTVTFDLQKSSFVRGNIFGSDYVAIVGTGLIHVAGYDATLLDFSVTFQDPASIPATQTFTFSASQHSVSNSVVSVVVPTNPPAITSFSLVNGNVVINGTNAQAGATYYLLSATNVAKPMAQWKTVATNVLPDNNNYTFTGTNAVVNGSIQRFYRLSSTNFNP